MEILSWSFGQVHEALNPDSEEKEFILFVEWDALRTAIAQYLGVEVDGVDQDRCRVTAIKHYEDISEISEVLLPPKTFPETVPSYYR